MENWHFSTEVEDMGFDETSCKFYLFITELKSLFHTYIYSETFVKGNCNVWISL